MTILGIDPSSKSVAIVGESGGYDWWFKHAWAKPSEKFVPEHIQAANETVNDFLARVHLDEQRDAFVEEPVVGVGVRATLVQALVSGGIQTALFDWGFRVHLVSNTHWKKEIGLSGRPSKEQITLFIEENWPYHAARCGGDQDLIDALGICVHGDGVVRRRHKLVGVRSV